MGVIFRRGPSKRVQLVHWDTATDTFTPGQWFHGRIYERLSHISPDGRLLIYAARKVNAHSLKDEKYTEFWTAISRPPYLTALALWPCRSSVGGGLFLSNRKVWLNHDDPAEPHPNHKPQGLKIVADGKGVLEQVLQNRRLERDGWKHIQKWQGELIESTWMAAFRERIRAGLPTGVAWLPNMDDLNAHYVTHTPSIHEKPHGSQNLALVMTTTLTGFQHRYAYSVCKPDGRVEEFAGAEWADWDQRGRLVYAHGGKLFAVPAEAIGQKSPRELADLNGNTPEAVEAPQWAKHW